MADATADQIKFAQSRINYFEEVLNKGEKDTLKTLVKVTGKTKADEIATAIQTAPSVTKKEVTDAKNAAEAAGTKLEGDIVQVAKDLSTVKGKVAGSVSYTHLTLPTTSRV